MEVLGEKRVARIALLSLFCLSISCGGRTEDEPISEPEPLELEELAYEYATQACANYSCLIMFAQEESARCIEETVALFMARGVRPLARGEVEGKLRYNPTLARHCLEKYKQAGCEALGRLEPLSCAGVVERFSGDSSCTTHIECGSHPKSFCDKSGGCPGKCSPVRAEGEACVNTAWCAAGSICRDGMCRAWLNEGATCDPGIEQLGRVSEQCSPGLLCWPQKDRANRCTASAKIQTAKLGQPCLQESLQLCEAGLHCDWEQRLCVNGAQAGELCEASVPLMCGVNRCLYSAPEGEERRCVGPKMDGAACESSGECSGPSACTAGICVFPRPAGAECWEDTNCLSWACVDGKCAELGMCPE